MDVSSGQNIPAFSGNAAICVGIIFALQSFWGLCVTIFLSVLLIIKYIYISVLGDYLSAYNTVYNHTQQPLIAHALPFSEKRFM
jgi:hypothetical protein